MRRRELLAGAIAISGSTLVAKASPLRSAMPEFKLAMTTLFWVGERSNAENNFIPNHESYWDQDWQTSYGGVDDPEIEMVIGQQDLGPRKIPSTWRSLMASSPTPTA